MGLKERLFRLEHSKLIQPTPSISSDMGQSTLAAGVAESGSASDRSSINTAATLNPKHRKDHELQHDSKQSNTSSSGEAAPKSETVSPQPTTHSNLQNSIKTAIQPHVKEAKPRMLAGLVRKFHDKTKASTTVESSTSTDNVSPEMARKFNNTDQPLLLRLLRSSTPRMRNERDEAVVCTLEMRIKPTVVFSCRTDTREQQIREALTGRVFKHCLGQCGYEAVTKIDASVGYRGAYAVTDDMNTLDPTWASDKQQIDVLLSSGAGTLRGSLIMVSVSSYQGIGRETKSSYSASRGPIGKGIKSVYSTFGGLVSVDGNFYGLTTAHAVWDDSLDQTSIAGELPEWVELAGTDLLPASGQVKGSNQTSYTASPERVDWLLFAVKPELLLPNLVAEYWSQEELNLRTKDTSCIIYSPKGSISGSLRLATSLVCLQRMDFQGYCIDLDEKLEQGESGSWVISEGRLLGIIVAASDDPPRAYAQAAFDVFDSISNRYSRRVALPSRAEMQLLDFKRIGRQQDMFLINDIPIDHLDEAIPLLMLSKTVSTAVDNRKHWLLLDRQVEDASLPVLPAPKCWSLSSHSLTNATSYSGLLWLGSLCPVADAVCASCELILVDKTGVPDEISKSQAGDNLTFLFHAFRALVSIQHLPNFLLALLKEFVVPYELIPSARIIAELALDLEDIMQDAGWDDSKEQLNMIKHDLSTREEISGFASLLAGLANAAEFDPQGDNVLLCFGPLGDWISLYCSEYLRLPYWRWRDNNGLQELINEWLSKEVVHPWPRVWIIDTPGRIYTSRAQNSELDETCKSLMSHLDAGIEVAMKPQVPNEFSAKAAEKFEKTLRNRIADSEYDAEMRERDKSYTKRRRNRRTIRPRKESDSDVAKAPLMTALQAAAANGHPDVVRRLLAAGADVNAPGRTWGTALQAAARRDNGEIVNILLQSGANVNAREPSNDTALQTAARSGHKVIVKMLLGNGADPNDVGGAYETALQSASRTGHLEIVEMLLKCKADPNLRGTSYDTALGAAASHGYHAIVDLLLKRGANPDV